MRLPVLVALLVVPVLGAAAGAVAYHAVFQKEPDLSLELAEPRHGDPVYRFKGNPCPLDDERPSRVPGRLRVEVVPLGSDQPVSAATLASLQGAADLAYPFLDVELVQGDARGAIGTIHVLSGARLDRWDGKPVYGLHCGGHIFMSALADQAAAARSTVVHEMGHLFGLCHEEGTWMDSHMGDTGIPVGHRRWSIAQRSVLDRWTDDGAKVPGACSS